MNLKDENKTVLPPGAILGEVSMAFKVIIDRNMMIEANINEYDQVKI